MAPADRADAREQADPVGGEDEDEDRGEEPERPVDQVRADDAFEQVVEALDRPTRESSARRRAPALIRRVAICAKTIRPTATIHVTTIELVIGKPNGRPISTAFCGRPCSTGCDSAKKTGGEGAHAVAGLSTAHAIAGTARPIGMDAPLAQSRRDPCSMERHRRRTSSGIPDVLRDAGGASGCCCDVVALQPFATKRFCAGAGGAELVRLLQPLSGRPRPGRESVMLRQTGDERVDSRWRSRQRPCCRPARNRKPIRRQRPSRPRRGGRNGSGDDRGRPQDAAGRGGQIARGVQERWRSRTSQGHGRRGADRVGSVGGGLPTPTRLTIERPDRQGPTADHRRRQAHPAARRRRSRRKAQGRL